LQIFIKTENYELWSSVTRGLFVLMTTVEGKAMEKTKDQYTNSYFMKFSKKL